MTQNYASKIRALLDRAEHPNTPPAEAASCRAKAEYLQREYRVAEEELIAQDATSVLPVVQVVQVCTYGSPYRQSYVDLFHYCATHAGLRTLFETDRAADRSGYVVNAKAVGYESDVRLAEALFTAARVVFTDRLEPQVRNDRSEAENVYALRSAGMERVRVAEAIWGNRDKANLSKVGRMYKAECLRRGEEPALDGRGVTGKVYREQYAQRFVSALADRLRRARNAADDMGGGGMELHGRKERVQEAFYTEFPHLRPSTEVVVQGAEKECEDCKRTKHESGQCKAHRPYVATKADRDREARWWAQYNSAAAQRGRQAGTTAAAHVDLSRTSGARRLDETTTATGTGHLAVEQ